MFVAYLRADTRKDVTRTHVLEAVHRYLIELCPTWCENVHVYEFSRRRQAVDGLDTHTFAQDVSRQIASDRLKTVELRGGTKALWLYLSSLPSLRPQPQRYPNDISFQIFRKRIEGIPYYEWCIRMLAALGGSDVLASEHATARLPEELEAKNVDRTGGGYRSLGVPDNALPGIYWGNFIGAPYCDLIGRDRLLSAPAYEVREVGKGVLIIMGKRPEEWNTPEYRERTERFLDHVGREFFFDRRFPDRPLKSPFHFPDPPPRDPSKDIHVLHLGGGKYRVLDPDERETFEQRPRDKLTPGDDGPDTQKLTD